MLAITRSLTGEKGTETGKIRKKKMKRKVEV